MRRLFLLVTILLFSALSASAQYVKVLGVAEQSNTVLTVGTASSTKAPRTFPSATIDIYASGTTTHLSIFSNSTGSVKSNPFVADSFAVYDFFVAPGTVFDVRISPSGGTPSPFTRAGYTAPGGSTGATVMACVGTNDTTILAAASVLAQTIIIPKGVTCASNSQTISAPLDVQYGGLLKPITGQTVILTGAQLAGPWQTFANATAGLGTVSFSGNTALAQVYPYWWGTLSTAGVVTASIAALPTGGGSLTVVNGDQTFAAFTVSKPTSFILGHGTYTMAVSASVTVAKNLIVQGQGGNKTMLVAASSQKLFNVSGVLDGGVGTGAFFALRDLTLDGASRAATNAVYVPNYSNGVSSFVSGQLLIENCVIENFGASSSYAVDLGNSVFFSDIRNTIFTGNEGGVRTGNNADITYEKDSFGAIRTLPFITTNGSSTRILDSSFVYSGGVGTTTPDVLITTDGTDAGYIHIARNKFGPEGEVNTRYKIRVYSSGSPSVVIPNITIDGDNQFSGVTGQTAISIENPVEHLLIDENYFNTFSTLINDAQLLANSSTGQNVFTASNRIAPAPTGTTIFANNGRGFTFRQVATNWLDERFIKPEYLTGLINRVPDSGAMNLWMLNGVTITTGQTDPLGGTTAFLLTRANASSQESINSGFLDFTSIATAQPGPTTGKQIVVDVDALAGSLSYMTITLYDFTASLPVVTKKVMLKSVWDTYRVPFTGLDQTHQYIVYIYPGNNAATQAGTVKVWRVNASDYGSAYIATDSSGNAATSTQGARFYAPVGFTNQLTSTLATGTAPLVIASTTKVSNLNADKVDGQDWADPGAIGGGTPAAGTFTTATGNTAIKVAATGKLTVAPKTNDTYGATMTIDVTISHHVIVASFTTSAAVTMTPSAAGSAGDILIITTEADASGTVTATFASTFHPSGTQATTASHFSTTCWISDGTRWLELYRTTNLA